MPVTPSDFLQELTTNSEYQATLLVIVVALAGLLYLLHKKLRRWRCERRTRKTIKRMGVRHLQDIRLSDGTGGEVLIEYLLLAPDALVIVGIKRFEGLIFGARLTDQWTQVLGRRSYKFENPDHYLQRQINAISQIVPDVTIRGWHLFPIASFPKDKPDNVLLMADLKNLPSRPRLRDIPAELQQAWEQVEVAVT